MPDFDVLTLSESRKRKSRSHGIRKKGNDKRKRCATMKLNTSLNVLAVKLRIHGRHPKRHKQAKIRKRRNQKKTPTPKTEVGKNQTNNQAPIP